MQSLNPEQNFLVQYQKYHTSSSPLPDNFLKIIIASDNVASEYKQFFNICINNKLDIFPAICHLLKEYQNSTSSNKFIFYSTINYFISEIYENKIKLNDEDIKILCETRVGFKIDTDFLKCELLKLNLVALVENEKTKEEFALKKISQILQFSDSLSVQKKILKTWNSMNLEQEKIEKMVPVLFDKKDFFSVQEEKFFKVELDANKLAYDSGALSNNVKKLCVNFVEKYEIENPEHIQFFRKNKTSQINIYFNNEQHVKKFKFFLDHFSQKMGMYFKFNEPNQFLISLFKDWRTLEHQYKLEHSLDIKNNSVKKSKI